MFLFLFRRLINILPRSARLTLTSLPPEILRIIIKYVKTFDAGEPIPLDQLSYKWPCAASPKYKSSIPSRRKLLAAGEVCLSLCRVATTNVQFQSIALEVFHDENSQSWDDQTYDAKVLEMRVYEGRLVFDKILGYEDAMIRYSGANWGWEAARVTLRVWQNRRKTKLDEVVWRIVERMYEKFRERHVLEHGDLLASLREKQRNRAQQHTALQNFRKTGRVDGLRRLC